MSSPAIVHKARFTTGRSRVFSSYIDYIDRDEATRNYKFNDFSLYNDYMGNPEKSGSLFTSNKDYLSKEERDSLKEKFKIAQKNGSLMWQDVFSFNNDWLVENGYYDDETHILDEEKLRGAVRRCMNNQLEKASMDTAIWSASFHYNTDNIHVHIATVELTNNPRERGKRTKSTIDRMKSNFINELRHREKEYKKINELIRDNIIKDREKFVSSDDKVLKEKTLELLKKLPNDRRYWNYGYNKINSAKPLLNAISKYYIETYHKEDYEELLKKLTIEELELKRIYGEGKEKERYKDYKKNKLDELNKRMGNSILKELREYVKEKEDEYKDKKNKNQSIDEKNSKDAFRINNKNINIEKENKKKGDKKNFENKNYEYKSSKDNFRTYDKMDRNNKEKVEDNILNKFSEEKLIKNIKEQSKSNVEYDNKINISINLGTMNRLKKAMKNEVEKYINQREYEKSERTKEYEKENDLEM